MPRGLGEFEQIVLLVVLHVEEEAHGVARVEEIETLTGRAAPRAAVHVMLEEGLR